VVKGAQSMGWVRFRVAGRLALGGYQQRAQAQSPAR
jgi:hypothetical protein